VVSNVNVVGTGQSLDESLNTIISKFKLLSQETPVIKPTATHYELRPGTGASYNVRNYGRVTAQNLSFGVDMVQAQALSDAPTAWTPAEAGVQVILSGQAMRQSADRALEANTAKMMNNAWQLKEDTDGCTQLASFTSTAVGAAGTVASPGHIAALASLLRLGNSRATPEPAPKPWHYVHHPNSMMVIRGRVIPFATTPGGGTAYGVNTGAHLGVTVSGMMSEWQQRMLIEGPGSLGQLEGILMREDANLSVNGSDDATGAAYSQEGLVYVEEVAPRMDPDTGDKSMRGAIELNLWGSYVWGNFRAANLGTPATFDCSNPSS
jgi:hypothetical protein